MRKKWHWTVVVAVSVLVSACSGTKTIQVPAPSPTPTHNGSVVEIGGVEPRYEAYNPVAMEDYAANGNIYRIVKDPQNFSQTGLATWYGPAVNGTVTTIGEKFDASALTAAHPTLPIPSYVRVTNTVNGRQLVVRVNDRGPYISGRIIVLSQAAANRLSLSNDTKIRVDFINVAPDGSLSGPGTIGTVVAGQNSNAQGKPPVPSNDNAATESVSPATGTTSRGTFLGEPSPLPSGILEGSEPRAENSAPTVSRAPATNNNTARAKAKTNFMVQIGAFSSIKNARNWQHEFSQQFDVPAEITEYRNLHRVRLGPFSSRQQAVELQRRLESEAEQESFIVPVH